MASLLVVFGLCIYEGHLNLTRLLFYLFKSVKFELASIFLMPLNKLLELPLIFTPELPIPIVVYSLYFFREIALREFYKH